MILSVDLGQQHKDFDDERFEVGAHSPRAAREKGRPPSDERSDRVGDMSLLSEEQHGWL